MRKSEPSSREEWWSALALALFLVVASFVHVGATPVVSAQSAGPVRRAPSESARPTSDPYTGTLSIFEEEGRAERLQIDRVMDLLRITTGSRVADIGAGSGWFTVRAARRAGSSGHVYAVDINKDYLESIAKRSKSENLPSIETVLGAEDDPRLPDSSVDAVLLLKTYHEIAKPVTLMYNLRGALRPNARVGIIDREGAGDDHGVAERVVVEEMERAGFVLDSRHDFVKPGKMDYFLVFKVRP